MLEKILPAWLRMEQNLEALKSGDMSDAVVWRPRRPRGPLLRARGGDHGGDPRLPATEPMAHIESFEDHYKWPDNWDLPS